MEIVDAQVHIWPPETLERPWLEQGHVYAHGYELTAAQLLARMEGAEVDKAVLVPPSWEGDRNDFCLDAAMTYPESFRVMGRVALAAPEAREAMDWWLALPGMLGVRLTFHRPFQRIWLEDGTADWFWPMAEDLGIPAMVLAPSALPEIAAVAGRHPRLRLIIDHLALMRDDYEDDIFAALAPVLELRRYPNIAVKASCLPNLTREAYPFARLQEVIRRVFDAFGRERTFWGSDLSRLRVPYHECVTLLTEQCSFLGSEDLEWVMGKGIRAWLGWND